MKAKDIFGIAVRLLGLVFLYQAFLPFPNLVALVLSKNLGGVLLTVIGVGWYLIMANWLLRGAPLLLRMAYPEEKNEAAPFAPTEPGSTPKA